MVYIPVTPITTRRDNMTTLRKKAAVIMQSGGFRKYFANTGWMMFNQVFNLAMAFFVGVYVARYLGPTSYGILSFSLSIIGFVNVFSALGLKQIIKRNLVREPHNQTNILGSAFFMQILASILAMVVLAICLPWISDDEITNLVILILSTKILLQAFEVITPHFESKVQSKKLVPISLAKTAIAASIKLYLIFVAASLEYFALVYVIETLVSVVGLIIVYQHSGGDVFRWRLNKSYAKQLLKDSWPLVLSGFVVVVYMQIDQVMIKYLLDDAAVGVYAVAVKFTSIWYFVGGIVCSSLMPAIIRAKEKNATLYQNRTQNLLSLMVFLGVGIALPLSLISKPLILFLYGPDFIGASNVMIIHIWSLIFVFLGVASNQWLIAENLQVLNLSRTMLSAVANISLNLFLIPNYGIQGAAFATFLAHMISSYLGYTVSRKTIGMFKMQTKALLIYPILYQFYLQSKSRI
ncbi:MAG: flippase [Cyclobacteriaceae bacterium]